MNDTLTLTIAAFDFLTPPFRNGNGGVQPKKLASPPVACRMCEEPLIEMEFPNGWEIVCDNWKCHLYRQPQGCRTKDPVEETSARLLSRVNSSTYQDYLSQKRCNYQELRKRGMPPKEATHIAGNNKQVEKIISEGSTQLALPHIEEE